MRSKGQHFEPNLASALEQFERAAPQNYADLVEIAAASRGAVGATPVPTVNIPDPLTQPRREVSREELHESAAHNFKKCYWEAAAGDFQKLLALGEPLAEIVPKLITCLLSAHEEVLPCDRARVEDLLRQLEAASHAALAAELPTQHAAKLARPKSPGGSSGDEPAQPSESTGCDQKRR